MEFSSLDGGEGGDDNADNSVDLSKIFAIHNIIFFGMR